MDGWRTTPMRLGGALVACILITAACSERTTPAAAPESTSDPAVETSPSQARQKTPQGEVPAENPPRS
ncbi:hypothetical protein P7B02_02425 [Caulobacter segnis]|uniref:hypothetical protein n=1 Tax=Caulobacter segnis TaxID=88688 RepID=UPI00240F4E5F|nr:hypothetical protein [Caulobacter segnis]MDG2520383.1 hypothetical protein [Caulobacter segnis]